LEILELLGQGGMGAVYKARQPKLDRFVALKILPPGRDAAFAERFTREARALAKLSHPAIVAVHDFGQTGDPGAAEPEALATKQRLYYFIMEYVDGVNLRQTLSAGTLTPTEALQIVPQICAALQYAHEEGIVHRDIKPENILLDKKGRVKIADFGLAKLLDRDSLSFQLTATHQVMGTPHYMAPEQMERPLEVDHRADIYSLGVVLYEMLTGELPLGRFAPPSQKANVDVRLDEVVLRALEKQPERRYQRVSEVKTDLESITAGRVQHPSAMLSQARRGAALLAGWSLLCLGLWAILWFPSYELGAQDYPPLGLIDRHLWPYQLSSTHILNLTPRSEAYRAVLIENQDTRYAGFASTYISAPDGSVPPGCTQWLLTVQVDFGFLAPARLHIDCLRELSWRSGAGSGTGQRRPLPLDRTDMLRLLTPDTDSQWKWKRVRDGNVVPVDAQAVNFEAIELLAIIRRCQSPSSFAPSSYPSEGRLEHVFQQARAIVYSGGPGYFEQRATQSHQVGPLFSINWIGIPLTVLVWLSGLWLIRRSNIGRGNRASQTGAGRFSLGRFLTYFWSQRGSGRSVSAGAAAFAPAAAVDTADRIEEVAQSAVAGGKVLRVHKLLDEADVRKRVWQHTGMLLGGFVFIGAAVCFVMAGMYSQIGLMLLGLILFLLAAATKQRWVVRYKGHRIRFENDHIRAEKLFLDDGLVARGGWGYRMELRAPIKVGEGAGDEIVALSEAGLFSFRCRITVEEGGAAAPVPSSEMDTAERSKQSEQPIRAAATGRSPLLRFLGSPATWAILICAIGAANAFLPWVKVGFWGTEVRPGPPASERWVEGTWNAFETGPPHGLITAGLFLAAGLIVVATAVLERFLIARSLVSLLAGLSVLMTAILFFNLNHQERAFTVGPHIGPYIAGVLAIALLILGLIELRVLLNERNESGGRSEPVPPKTPEQQVRGPAIGLLVTGVLHTIALLLVFVVGGGLVLHGGYSLPGPKEMKQTAPAAAPDSIERDGYKVSVPEPVVGTTANIAALGAFVLIVYTIVGLAMGVFMVAGAWKMLHLRSLHLAMACSCLALVPCNVLWLLGLPLGLWALVVLQRPAVQAAFSLNNEKRKHDVDVLPSRDFVEPPQSSY
jgi:serine/threonine protein kinase